MSIGKDVFWYTREKQEEEAAKARLEMQAIKQREEDFMNEVSERLHNGTVLDMLSVSVAMMTAGFGPQTKDNQAGRQAKAGLTRYGQIVRPYRV